MKRDNFSLCLQEFRGKSQNQKNCERVWGKVSDDSGLRLGGLKGRKLGYYSTPYK